MSGDNYCPGITRTQSPGLTTGHQGRVRGRCVTRQCVYFNIGPSIIWQCPIRGIHLASYLTPTWQAWQALQRVAALYPVLLLFAFSKQYKRTDQLTFSLCGTKNRILVRLALRLLLPRKGMCCHLSKVPRTTNYWKIQRILNDHFKIVLSRN